MLEAIAKDADVAVGVVDETAELVKRRERVLAQLDHGARVPGAEQALDGVHHLLDAAAPVVGLLVRDEVAGVNRKLNRPAEARHINLVRIGRESKPQSLEYARVRRGLLNEQ